MHDVKKEKEYVPMWSIGETTLPTVKEYKTITSASPAIFDTMINFALKQGWQLYGHPHVILSQASKTHLLVQTLVLYEDIEPVMSVS